MSMLQADILTMMQSIHANDRLRNEHTHQSKAAITDLKRCVLGYMVNVCDTYGSAKIAMRNMSSSVMGQVIALEDRVRSMEAVMETHIESSKTYTAECIENNVLPEIDGIDPYTADVILQDNMLCNGDTSLALSNRKDLQVPQSSTVQTSDANVLDRRCRQPLKTVFEWS